MTAPVVEPIVEFDSISKSFGGVQALDSVSFAVPRGEVHALVGENGAGKSTLIRICGGVFPPDTGCIRFDGAEVAFKDPLESRHAGISIVHQEIPVCPDMTAAENIFLGDALPRRAGLIDWNEVNRRARALFDRLAVDIDPTDIVGALPIAKQQIVAIAQALSLNARLVIMDEPTSALSRQEVAHLFEIIRQLKANGITIVYVSHRLEEVFDIADRITVLRDGHYIGTLARENATPDRVVQMMVGREISNLFPKVFHEKDGTVLLSVRKLHVPGACEDVSFDLHAGEVLGLVGLQGSGTSEILRALFGQYPDASGEITICGERVHLTSSLDAIRHGVAYVPADRQHEGLFAVMSVRDNAGLLRLPGLAKLFGWIPGSSLNRLVQEAVTQFSIRAESISTLISSLSGGNQQKVVIARSLSTKPLIILLDDPTRGVDVGAKAEVHHILNQLTGQGCGVILISSELPEVLAMSDRCMVMYRGQMRALLPHDEANHELVMVLATGVEVAAANS
jgi:ABC-type sugar transport system ATPase subunit